MSCRSTLERWLRLAILLLGMALPHTSTLAAPAEVLPFDGNTWNSLLDSPGRPLVVVFSTTDCVHCPKVIKTMADAIQAAQSGTRLVVVVVDGLGLEKHLRQDKTYRKADALYVFHGDELALRFSVNPEWRGLTPYIAFVQKSGAASFHTGLPAADSIRRFLR